MRKKKVKWKWDDTGIYTAFCPYCDEYAYREDRCISCKKEYKWVQKKTKSTMQIVKAGKYTVVQTSTNFIRIFDGLSSVGIHCTKRLPKHKLKKLSRLMEYCKELEPESFEYTLILKRGGSQ